MPGTNPNWEFHFFRQWHCSFFWRHTSLKHKTKTLFQIKKIGSNQFEPQNKPKKIGSNRFELVSTQVETQKKNTQTQRGQIMCAQCKTN